MIARSAVSPFLFAAVLAGLMTGGVLHADVGLPKTDEEEEPKRGLFRFREERTPTPEPPSPTELRVPVPAGQRVETLRSRPLPIVLGTIGDPSSQRVLFRIRNEPAAGTLGEVARAPDHLGRAVVTYTPDPSSNAALDRFTFAASYPGGRVSAPVAVEIRLVDPEPVLETPATVDFGQVFLGQSATRRVPVTNAGAAPFTGELQAPAPWKWIVPDAPKPFRIEPGQTITVNLRFEPTETGPAVYRLPLPGQEVRELRLSGEGLRPFGVLESALELKAEPSGVRAGVLPVAAPHRPVTLEVETSPRLRLPTGDRLLVPAGEPLEARLELPASDPEAFRGQVTLRLGTFETTVEVEAPAAPPRVVLTGSRGEGETLDFGRVPVGESELAVIRLRNAGGEPASVSPSFEGPFALAPGSDTGLPTRLDPGAEDTWVIRFEPRLAQDYRGSLTLQGQGGGGVLKLAGSAASLATSATPAPDRLPPAATPRSSASPPRTPVPPSRASTPPAKASRTSAPIRPPAPRTLSSSETQDQQAPPRRARSYAELLKASEAEKKRAPTLEELQNREALREDIQPVVKGKNGAMPLPVSLTRDGMLSISPFRKQLDLLVPRVERITVFKAASKSAELVWKRPSPYANLFEMEIRTVRFNESKKRFEVVWVPWEKVSFNVEEAKVFATLKALEPQAYYVFRAFHVKEDGRHSFPSDEVAVHTRPVAPAMDALGITFITTMITGSLGVGYFLLQRQGLL